MLFSFIFICLFILSLMYKDIVISTSLDSLVLWAKVIFPTMFFSFIIVDMISKSKLSYIISKKMFKFCNKVLKLNYEKSGFILVMSLLVGNPGGSKLINEALQNEEIDLKEANYLLKFTSFMSPMFLLVFISSLDSNPMFIIIFLLSYYISNFLVMFAYQFKMNTRDNESKLEYQNYDYVKEFVSSISKNINVLLNILGVIVFFNVFSNILNQLFDLHVYADVFLSLFMEILSGTNKLKILNMPLISKGIISSFFISFGGISIHFQILSICDKMNYLSFFFFKLIIALVNSILFGTLFLLI